jgi:hypothetical protein
VKEEDDDYYEENPDDYLFPNLDEHGKEYGQAIVDNVIERLKMALGIPDDDTTHAQLQAFFCEKFTKVKRPEFLNNQTELGKEILSNMVFGTVTTEDDKKRAVSIEARKLRENMIGYVDSIVERQDRYDILKRLESFQIE